MKFTRRSSARREEGIQTRHGVWPAAAHGDECFGLPLQASDNRPSDHGPLIYLSVEGRLDAAIKAVRNTVARSLWDKEPIGPYGFRGVIMDSEGNRIALHSQRRCTGRKRPRGCIRYDDDWRRLLPAGLIGKRQWPADETGTRKSIGAPERTLPV